MLRRLTIRNLALIEALELEFTAGFTALTGETGAGKSVVLGALRMLSGERVERSLIRSGADVCEIAGHFYFKDSKTVDSLLESIGLPSCEEGHILLRRSLPRDPKRTPRITINGTLSTLANLRLLGEYWIDFHGAGETQKKSKERSQLEMLDRYAKLGVLLETYQSHYRRWRDLIAEQETIITRERLSAEEQDFYRSQIAQIDAIDLSKDSIQALERDFTRLENSREIEELTATTVTGLTEGETSVNGHLRTILRAAQRLSKLDPETAELTKRLEALIVEVDDLAGAYAARHTAAGWDQTAESQSSPEDVRQRMNRWLELQRRYGDSVEAVRKKRTELAHKLAVQTAIERRLEHINKEAATLEVELRERAATLQKERHAVSGKLTDRCNQLIASLGFKNAEVRIDLIPEAQLTEHGDCRCVFQFAPNGGTTFMPFNKIASSGEAARVMLALKAILAEVDQTPVLVFDEVDANVGGEIGSRVGMELATLGRQHQIFCVTHLPQAAARADAHYAVVKAHAHKNATSVSIKALHTHQQKRIDELARMLGDRHSESALRHAAALLDTTQKG